MKEELTLSEASIFFEVDENELFLALASLEGRKGTLSRRLVRDGVELRSYYRSEEVEEAIALSAARRLGFDED